MPYDPNASAAMFDEPTQAPAQAFPDTAPLQSQSDNQANLTALNAALAKHSLTDGQTNPFDDFSNNKEQIKAGNEQGLRDEIGTLEKNKTTEVLQNQFIKQAQDPFATPEDLKATVDVAKDHQVIKPDAVEFNALDAIRVDNGTSKSSDTLDKGQSLLASGALLNKKLDAKNLDNSFKGVMERMADPKTGFRSTWQAQSILGVANGLPELVNQGSITVQKALPNAYWKMLNNGDYESFKQSVIANTGHVAPEFSLNDTGKAVSHLSAFSIAMLGPLKAFDAIGATTGINGGVNALRNIGSGVLAGQAFDPVEDSLNQIAQAYPNLPLPEYFSEKPSSFSDSKFRQALSDTGLMAAGEGGIKIFGELFKGAKSYIQAKNSLIPAQKIAANPINTTIAMGDTNSAAVLADGKLNDINIDPVVDKVISEDHALESVTPSILKTDADVKMDVGIQSEIQAVANKRAYVDKITKINSNYFQVARLNATEQAAANQSTKESILGIYGQKAVSDVSFAKEGDFTMATVQLGNKDGTAFASEEEAHNAAVRMGFTPKDYELQTTPSGSNYIKTQHTVTEVGFTQPVPINLIPRRFANPFLQPILNAFNYVPEAVRAEASVAALSRAPIKNTLVTPIAKRYVGIPKDDFNAVNTILATSRDAIREDGSTGVWFTDDEFSSKFKQLTGKSPSEKVIDSHRAYKEGEYLAYLVGNDQEFNKKAAKGMIEFRSNREDFSHSGNAIVQGDLSAINKYHVYDPESGKVLSPLNPLTSEELSKYEGHKVVALEGHVQVGQGNESAKYIVMKPHDFTAAPLDRFQVSYREGPRVNYPGKYFSKQANTSVMSDGSTILLNPHTHFTSLSRQQLIEHTTALEDARLAFKSAVDGDTYKTVRGIKQDGTFVYKEVGGRLTNEEANKIITRTAIRGVDDFGDRVAAGTLSKDHAFEVRRDKELPSLYDKSTDISYVDPDHSGVTSYLTTQGQTKFRGRGDRLYTPEEEASQVLSPQATLERSLNSVINAGKTGNYILRAQNQFSETAKAFGLLKPEFMNSSPSEIFSEGLNAIQSRPQVSKTGFFDKDYQALKGLYNSTRRTLGFKSTSTLMYEETVEKYAEWCDKQGISPFTHIPLSPDFKRQVANLSESNPLRGFNTLLHYSNFGFFNTSQFIIQGVGGALATIAQEPIKGMQAGAAAIFYSAHLFHEGASEAMSKLTPAMKLMGFKDGEQAITLANLMKKAGAVDATGSHIDFGKQISAATNRGTGTALFDSAIKLGDAPLRTGEALNQMVAFHAAAMKMIDEYPKMAINSSEFAGHVLAEQEKILFNMRGVMSRQMNSVPALNTFLKYKNFSFNVLEALTTSTAFTPAQKAKMGVGMVGMFGTTSYYGMDSMLKNAGVDEKANPGLTKAYKDGIIGALVDVGSNHKLDLDTTGMFSPIQNLEDYYLQIATSDNKLWPTMGGPLYSKVQQAGDHVGKALHFLEAIDNAAKDHRSIDKLQMTEEAAKEVGKVVSSWNNYEKGQVAFRTQQTFDRTGSPIVNNISQETAIAMITGLKSGEEARYWRDTAPKVKDIYQKAKDRAAEITSTMREGDTIDINTPQGQAAFKALSDKVEFLTTATPDVDPILIQKAVKGNIRKGMISSADKAKRVQDLVNANIPTGE